MEMEVEVWFQGQYEVAAQARPSKHGCSELHVDLSDLSGLFALWAAGLQS